MADVSGDQANNFFAIGGLVGAAVVGSVTQSTKWVDAKTGKFSPLLMISGIALCLVFASVVHWVGVEKGIDTWTQIVITSVGSYIGPDPIIRAFYSTLLQRAGVKLDAADTKGDAKP